MYCDVPSYPTPLSIKKDAVSKEIAKLTKLRDAQWKKLDLLRLKQTVASNAREIKHLMKLNRKVIKEESGRLYKVK